MDKKWLFAPVCFPPIFLNVTLGCVIMMQSFDAVLRKWVDLVTLLYQFGELWFCSPFRDAFTTEVFIDIFID